MAVTMMLNWWLSVISVAACYLSPALTCLLISLLYIFLPFLCFFASVFCVYVSHMPVSLVSRSSLLDLFSVLLSSAQLDLCLCLLQSTAVSDCPSWCWPLLCPWLWRLDWFSLPAFRPVWFVQLFQFNLRFWPAHLSDLPSCSRFEFDD